MSSNSDGTADPGSSSTHPPAETITSVTAQIGQGDEAAWNFENLEDKNPFSGFSEEHLNKLDEVLSSAEVREILQQSATGFNLGMNLEEGNQLEATTEPVELQESDLSVLTAAFSDHAYAVPPDRAPKTKPLLVTTATKPKPVVVTVGPSELEEENVIDLPPVLEPMIHPEPPAEIPAIIEVPPASPVAFSPRKSGRPLKSKRYGDEEWVTSSPRGRGRGRGSPRTESPTGFGSLRQSSRISDQKQRELAEKILQANRQALEAEKVSGSPPEKLLAGIPTENLGTSEQLEVKGRGRGRGRKSKQEEVDVDDIDVEVEKEEEKSPGRGRGRGRGKGRGKKGQEEEKKVGRNAASSQDDEKETKSDDKDTDDKTTADDDDDGDDNESENEDEETEIVEAKTDPVKKKAKVKKSIWATKRRKKKKKAVKKVAASVETEDTVDSDIESDEDEEVEINAKKKTATGKKVKKKGKKKETGNTGDSEEISDSEKDVKMKKKTVKGKAGKRKAQTKGKDDTVDSEDQSDSEEDTKTKKKTLKGKKVEKVKEKLKGKKLKVKGKKKDSIKKGETQTSDMETDDKSKNKKAVKKMTKQELIKKLKEDKKLKKAKLQAKLLEKKKAKLKAKKLQKGKGKTFEVDSDKSPKKKKKVNESENDKSDDTQEKVTAKGKKKALVPEVEAPAKKKKGKPAEGKADSENQSSPKKKKVKLTEDKTESEIQSSPKKKKGKLPEKKDTETQDSPKKKGKQIGINEDDENETKDLKAKKVLKDKGKEEPASPTKNKKGRLKEEKMDEDKEEVDTKKSPVKGGKRKETDDSLSGPAKKKKPVKEEKSLTKGAHSDSDEDVPLKTIKSELQDNSMPQHEKEAKESLEIKAETKDQKVLEQTKEKQTDKNPKTVTESKVDENMDVISDVKSKVTVSELDQKVTASDSSSVKVDETGDKKEGKRKLSIDKDSFEIPSKRRDSRDSSKDSKDDKHHHHSHHGHHHHRHSRDSRDSVSEERRRSHDRKDSHRDRTPPRRKDSHSSSRERKESVSSSDRDKGKLESRDKKSSLAKDRKDSLKDVGVKGLKKERRSSVASAGSDKTPAKVEKKKSRKSEDIPVDASLIDLFKPDVTPKQKDKLKAELSVEEGKVTSVKAGLFESLEANFKSESVKDKTLSLNSETVNCDEIKDRDNEILGEKAVISILSKCDNTDEVTGVSVEKKDNIHRETVEIKATSFSPEIASDLIDNEIKVEKIETAADLLKTLDSDKSDASQKPGIKEEKSRDKSKEVKAKDTDKVEKVKVGESEPKVIKIPVPGMIRKERSPKGISDKKRSDKTKKLGDKRLSGDKDKRSDSKDKTPGKAERARSLSTEKLGKSSSEKKLKPAIKVTKDTSMAKKRLMSGDSAKKKHLSGDSIKKRKLSGDSKQRHPSGEGRSRPNRNKSVSFAEILRKEKLGSDDEDNDDDDSDFNDDETDETWEEPGKLYCLCRQPHNKRFMICCDKCEEWFHGKCVGISRARGEEMEKNDEEYICPQCSENEDEMEEKTVVTSTESPDQSHKKTEAKPSDTSERTSLFESLSTTSTHSTDKSEPDSTVVSPAKRESIDSETSLKGKHDRNNTPAKVKQAEGDSPRKGRTSEDEKGKVGYIRKRSPKEKVGLEKKKRIKSFEPEKPKVVYSKRKCLCGCNKLAKMGSLFSEKECQERHERNKREESEAAKQAAIKLPQEKRIAVVERGTGKLLTGHRAPRESELKEWLQKHPTFEILKSHRRLSSKSQSPGLNSSVDTGSDTSQISDKDKSSDDSKSDQPLPEGPEPVRLNVRKGLRDALAARADAAEDVVLSNSEIKGLSLSIEEEMFNYFKDTDHKYKAKYRSLVFNIKDQKNKGLFRKILNRRVRPNQLVRMTPEELASQELSKWREQETKHQLEMIEQTEAELEQEHPHITKKTHKGEVEVEQEGEEDLSSLSVVEPKKEAPKIDPKADLLSAILPDTTDQHGKHLFDSNCKVCTGKVVPHTESAEPNKTTVVVTEAKSTEEEPEPSQKEKDLQAEEVVKEVLKAIKKAQIDAQREAIESQKRASSVTVRSPDSALSSGLDKKVKFTPSGPQLWKGFIYMQDVSKFVTTAYRVTGPAENLELPDTIHVCGRINPEHVWDYLSKIKQAASRDICVIRFIPGNNEEKVAYINLYSYLNSRSRCGVVANSAKHIKDFYIVPLASHSKIPAVLKPFDGPGLEENRCHMLIGVIIRNKVKSTSVSGTSSQTHKQQDPRKLKSSLKDPVADDKSTSSSSSSSTPLSSASSSTPLEKKKKVKSISFDPIVKEYSHISSDQEEADDSNDPDAPYDPEKEAENTTPKQEDRPYSPSQGEVLGIAKSLKTAHKQKSKQDDPVSKMIEKIALSKNPVEATATMVAALATSARLGNQNQRKLLLELTKKVDEQKRMLEQKRISSLAAQSPSSISSSTSPSDRLAATASTSGSSPHSSTRKSHLNKNDPRLKSKSSPTVSVTKETSVKDTSVSTSSDTLIGGPPPAVVSVLQTSSVYSPLKDLQASKLSQISSMSSPSTKATVDSDSSTGDRKDNAPTSPTIKPFSFTVKSKVHPVLKSAIDDDSESKVILPKLDDETIMKPKGFYVDHGEKSLKDNEQINATTKSIDSSKNIDQHSQGSGWKVVSSETDSILDRTKMSANINERDKTDADITDLNRNETGSELVAKESTLDNGEGKNGTKEETAQTSRAYDIVSQLQAEVSGTSKTDSLAPSAKGSKESDSVQEEVSASQKLSSGSSDSKEKLPFDILSQLHASVWGAKSAKDQGKTSKQTDDRKESTPKSSLLETDSSKPLVKLPANILNIIKEVSEKPVSKAQPRPGESQQTGQLPNALMSLFSSVPSSDAQTESSSKIDTSVADEDLRFQLKKANASAKVGSEEKAINPSMEAKAEIKVSKEKLSKSFFGFDYDSDSDSEGSFEGFDDDGVKSLSPRKRKLVAKQSPIQSEGLASESTNEFGDIDIRVKPKSKETKEKNREDKFELPAEDVDLRHHPESKKSERKPTKDSEFSKEKVEEKEDKDMRKVPGVHPTQPGEERKEYDAEADPAFDVDERIKRREPIGAGFPADKSDIRPPVLLDVDHRRPPFPGPLPPGLRPPMPFLLSNQPPPPGEDWQPGQPAPPPLPPGPRHHPPPLPKGLPPPPLPPMPPKQEEAREGVDKEKVKVEESTKAKESDKEKSEDVKDKIDSTEEKDKKQKKDKKEKEKKKGPLTSDERLKAIVLEIARKEPIEPPPLPPMLQTSLGPPMPMPIFTGPPPLSGPPAPIMSVPGPMLSQPPTLNPPPPIPVTSQGLPFTSHGPPPPMPQLIPEGISAPPSGPWNGPPAASSPGPPPLMAIDIKAPMQSSSRPPKLKPAGRGNTPSGPPALLQTPKPGLLPIPLLPPSSDESMGPGHVGPNIVSSTGPPPFRGLESGGPSGSPHIMEDDDLYPPPLIPGLKGHSDDRHSRERSTRHRDRDRHSSRDSRERDRDKHRHRHRDDREHRSSRERYDHSDRSSSDRHRDDRHRDSDHYRDDVRYRDNDHHRSRSRERDRNRDDHHRHKHKKNRH